MEILGIILIIVLTIVTFAIPLIFVFNPKIRGKMMSTKIKATKYMMDESKNDIKSISSDMAEATEEAVETTTRAVKKGLTKEESIYCKHCGEKIDNDSKFCKHCGKSQ